MTMKRLYDELDLLGQASALLKDIQQLPEPERNLLTGQIRSLLIHGQRLPQHSPEMSMSYEHIYAQSNTEEEECFAPVREGATLAERSAHLGFDLEPLSRVAYLVKLQERVRRAYTAQYEGQPEQRHGEDWYDIGDFAWLDPIIMDYFPVTWNPRMNGYRDHTKEESCI